MIDSELAHEIVNKLRGNKIQPSDVLEALVIYEHRLDLENKINQLEADKLELSIEILDMNDYLATNQLTKAEHDRIKKHVEKAEQYLKSIFHTFSLLNSYFFFVLNRANFSHHYDNKIIKFGLQLFIL